MFHLQKTHLLCCNDNFWEHFSDMGEAHCSIVKYSCTKAQQEFRWPNVQAAWITAPQTYPHMWQVSVKSYDTHVNQPIGTMYFQAELFVTAKEAHCLE
jgi:hypothetical protein